MPLLLEIVTPERLAYSETVDSVVLPGADGELGVLPHHAPLLSTLGVGRVVFGSSAPTLDPEPALDATRSFGDAVMDTLCDQNPSRLLA